MKSNRQKLIDILTRHEKNDKEILILKDILKSNELEDSVKVKLEGDLLDLKKIGDILLSEEIQLLDKITL